MQLTGEQPPISKQQRKYNLSLAGEFFVAAELQRRGVIASVTYGNAKKAEVVAFSSNISNTLVIEVKSAAAEKWVVGNKNPEPSEDLWVLVHIPEDQVQPTRYFILTSRDILDLLEPEELENRRKFYARNGHESTGVGVYSVRLNQVNGQQIESFEDKSDTILSRVPANV